MEAQGNQLLQISDGQIPPNCSNCGLSFDLLNHTPYKLSCAHTACKSCLRVCHKEKKDYQCVIDSSIVKLIDLRTLQKNIDIINKLRGDKALTSPITPGSQNFKFSQDSVNRKKDHSQVLNDSDYFQANSLQSVNITPQPLIERHQQEIQKLDLKKSHFVSSNEVLEEEKTPHKDDHQQLYSNNLSYSQERDINKSSQKQQPTLQIRANNILSNNKIEEVLEEESRSSMRVRTDDTFKLLQNQDESNQQIQNNYNNETLQYSTVTRNFENSNVAASQNNLRLQTSSDLSGIKNDIQTHNSRKSMAQLPSNRSLSQQQSDKNIVSPGQFLQTKDVSYPHQQQMNFPRENIQQSSQNELERIEDPQLSPHIPKSIVTKSDEQQIEKQINNEQIPMKRTETLGKIKISSKKKNKKKKKKKGNNNISHWVDESYYDGIGGEESPKSIKNQNQEQIPNDLSDYVDNLWVKYDTDKDGYLVESETVAFFQDVVIHQKNLRFSREQHQQWFKTIDKDKDGAITKQEMFDYFASINFVVSQQNQDFSKEELEAYMDYLWYKYDSDGDGFLSIQETKAFYFDLIRDRPDLNLTLDKHEDWFYLIDYDHDGSITRLEMMTYFEQIKYSGKSNNQHQKDLNANEYNEKDLIAYVDDLWVKYDTDKDGYLVLKETIVFFGDLIKNKGNLGFKMHQHVEWFKTIDIDNDGTITKQEMYNYFQKLNFAVKNLRSGFSLEQLEAYMDYLWFKYDTDEDGFLILQETRPFFEELIRDRPDLGFTLSQHKDWFQITDKDHDGTITKDEMLNYFATIGYAGKNPGQENHAISKSSLHLNSQDLNNYVEDIWVKYDQDRDGFLTFNETKALFADLVRHRPELGFSFAKHREWFSRIDKDKDGTITKDEMIIYYKSLDQTDQIFQGTVSDVKVEDLEAYIDYLWFKYDTDKDGYLVMKEIQPFYQDLITNRPDINLGSDNHIDWFSLIDLDNDGAITKEEMLQYFEQKTQSNINDIEQLKVFVDDLWNMFDTDNDGYLTCSETKPIFDDLLQTKHNLGFNQNQHQSWFLTIDIDNDGAITKPEMYEYFRQIDYLESQNKLNHNLQFSQSKLGIQAFVYNLWAKYDTDDDGYLVLGETRPFFIDLILHRPDLGLHQNQHQKWFHSIDKDNDGAIQREEMVNYFNNIKYFGKSQSQNNFLHSKALANYVNQLWKILDSDNDGFLVLAETKSFYEELAKSRPDLKLTSEKHSSWFRSIDKDNDGAIQQDEMYGYFLSINYYGNEQILINIRNLQTYVDYIWIKHDIDNDGYLTQEETKDLFVELMHQRPDLRLTLDKHTLWFRKIDKDNDGAVQKDEMFDYLASINFYGKDNIQEQMANLQAYVNQIWKIYDSDNDGYLTLQETRAMFEQKIKQRPDLGWKSDQHKSWFLEIDRDNDGAITKDEMFKYLVTLDFFDLDQINQQFQRLQDYVDNLWKKYDSDSDGFLVLNETKAFYEELLRQRPDLQLQLNQHSQWFKLIDRDNDGSIQKEEMFDYFASVNFFGIQIPNRNVGKLQKYVDELWQQYDTDNDGFLTLSETQPFFEDLLRNRKDLNLKPQQHVLWFRKIDKDNDGAVQKDEMFEYFSKINYFGIDDTEFKLNSLRVYVDSLMLKYDSDHDGYLILEETKPFYQEFSKFKPQLQLSLSKHQAWFRSIDIDNDGSITREEIFNYFVQINYFGYDVYLEEVQSYVDQLWSRYDQDQDGYLIMNECKPFYEDLVRHRGKELGLTSEKLPTWFSKIDQDNDGTITKHEMFDYFVSIHFTVNQNDQLNLESLKIYVDNLWAKYDSDNDGFLILEETKVFYEDLIKHRIDLGLSPDKHYFWFRQIDLDNDGSITKQEMFNYFASINYSGRLHQLVEDYVERLWELYDTDKDNHLTFIETKPFFNHLLKDRPDLLLKPESHRNWFQSIDYDNDGAITKEEMIIYFISINYSGTPDRLKTDKVDLINLQAYLDYLWTQFDADRDGQLELKETKTFFNELINQRQDLKMKQEDHQKWFRSIDIDNDGVITRHEMLDYFIHINYSGKPLQHILKYVNELWAKYDSDKDGFLVLSETKPFFSDLVQHRSDLKLHTNMHEKWFYGLDMDQDGHITKEEMFHYFINVDYFGTPKQISTMNLEQLTQYVEQLWAHYDEDNDGFLIMKETRQFYIDLIKARPDLNLSIEKHSLWFSNIDHDNDGSITKDEMYTYFLSINYSGKTQVLNELEMARLQTYVDDLWAKYDADKDGFLAMIETRSFFGDLVINRPDLNLKIQDHDKWFQQIDLDNDGIVNKHEMVQYFASLNYAGNSALLDQYKIASLKGYVDNVWARYDTDKDGFLNLDETFILYNDLVSNRPDLNLMFGHHSKWFKQIDIDGDGSITKQEMFNYFTSINYTGKSNEMDQVSYSSLKSYVDSLWQTYDSDSDGFLVLEETKQFFIDLVNQRPDLGLQINRHIDWFKSIDVDNDGAITKDEMFEYFAKINYFGKASQLGQLKLYLLHSYVEDLWARYDSDKDGFLIKEETEKFFIELVQNRPDLSMMSNQLEEWFNMIDVDRDGTITKYEMFNYFASIEYTGKSHLDQKSLEKLQHYVNSLWNKYDTDKDGYLTLQETTAFFQDLIKNRKDLKIQSSKHQQWFLTLDVDNDGVITKPEMFNYFAQINYSPDSLEHPKFDLENVFEYVEKIWETYDTDKDGYLLLEETKPFFEDLVFNKKDLGLSLEHHKEWFQTIDKDQDGSIIKIEMIAYLNSLNNPLTTSIQKQSSNLNTKSNQNFQDQLRQQKGQEANQPQKYIPPNQRIKRAIRQQKIASQDMNNSNSNTKQNAPFVKKVTRTQTDLDLPKQQLNKSSDNYKIQQQYSTEQEQKPFFNSRNVGNKLPDLKSNDLTSSSVVLAPLNLPQSHHSPLVKGKLDAASHTQKYNNAMNNMKEFIPKISNIKTTPIYQGEDFKREEESDIILSSKQSEGRIGINQMHNNYLQSDKSYEYLPLELRDIDHSQAFEGHKTHTTENLEFINKPHHQHQYESLNRNYATSPASRISSKYGNNTNLSQTLPNKNNYQQKSPNIPMSPIEQTPSQSKVPQNLVPLSENCKYHSREMVKYFCRDQSCQKGLCPDCIIEHSKHDFLAANELAAFEIKQTIKQSLRKCKNQVKHQREIKAKTEKKLSQLNKYRSEEFERLHRYFLELHKALDEREAQLNSMFNGEVKDTESQLMKDLQNIQIQYGDTVRVFKQLKHHQEQQQISSEIAVVGNAELAFQLSQKTNQIDSIIQNSYYFVQMDEGKQELITSNFNLNLSQEKEKIASIGSLIEAMTLNDGQDRSLTNPYFGAINDQSLRQSPVQQKVPTFANLKDSSRDNSQNIIQQQIQMQNSEFSLMNSRIPQSKTISTQTSQTDFQQLKQITGNDSKRHTNKTPVNQRDLDNQTQSTSIIGQGSFADINYQNSKNIHWFKWDSQEVFRYDLENLQWVQRKEIKNTSKFLFFSSIVHLPNEQGCFILGGADNENNYSKRVQYFCKYNVFVEKPPMINKRAFFPSIFAKLDNSIYAIGGSDSNQSDLSKCEKFSLIENVWRPVSPMNLSRNGTGAVIFEQYRLIFAFGGNNHKHGSLNKIEKYEIDFDKWSIITMAMKTAIHDLTAFCIGRERVLIFGGHTNTEPSKEVQMIDLSFECFKSKSGKNNLTMKEGGKTYFPPFFDSQTGKVHLLFGYCDVQPNIEELEIGELINGANNIQNSQRHSIERRSQSFNRSEKNNALEI